MFLPYSTTHSESHSLSQSLRHSHMTTEMHFSNDDDDESLTVPLLSLLLSYIIVLNMLIPKKNVPLFVAAAPFNSPSQSIRQKSSALLRLSHIIVTHNSVSELWSWTTEPKLEVERIKSLFWQICLSLLIHGLTVSLTDCFLTHCLSPSQSVDCPFIQIQVIPVKKSPRVAQQKTPIRTLYYLLFTLWRSSDDNGSNILASGWLTDVDLKSGPT